MSETPHLIADGIYPLLDEKLYRNDPAIAVSDLKEMNLSPAHFYSKKFGGYRTEQTHAQYIGTLTHFSALEPDEYVKRVILSPPDLDGAQPIKHTAAYRLSLSLSLSLSFSLTHTQPWQTYTYMHAYTDE